MIDLSDCVQLGEITRTHGIRGQVALRLNSLKFDDILEMESVFILFDGLPVPFFISEFEEKNADTLILTFDDIAHESDAKGLINKLVFLANESINIEDNPLENIDHILGFEVYDQKKGRLGVLEDILDFQINPLFQIIDGKKEILVPMQEEFIQRIDSKKKIIYLNTPEGLTDLYL